MNKVRLLLQKIIRHIHRFNLYVRCNKKKSSIYLTAFIALVTLIVPASRYAILGAIFHRPVRIVIKDSTTGEIVQSAELTLGNQTTNSSDTGTAEFKNVRTGDHTVYISKPFYTPLKARIRVGLFGNGKQQTYLLTASGRLVKAHVKNRLNGLPIEGVSVQATSGGSAKTNKDGIATLVLPYDISESEGFINGPTIVSSPIHLRSSQDSLTNIFLATPIGNVYFLSGASGTIDLVKTNLDGTNRQVVLAGTGFESRQTTKIFTSLDSEYVMLMARRDSGNDALYLIETATNKVTRASGEVDDILPLGWVKNLFIYRTDATSAPIWQQDRSRIFSYNTSTKTTTVLDKTRSEGESYLDFAAESIGDIYLTHDSLVYVKSWSSSYYYGSRLADKRITVNTIDVIKDTAPKVRYEWQAGYNAFIRGKQSGPKLFYYFVQLDGVKNSYWQFDGESVKQTSSTGPETFSYVSYPDYIYSPNGLYVVWSEQRDGKNTLLIGDQNAKNEKILATATDMTPIGWASDDYILLSRNGYELFIAGRDGISAGNPAVKISDYHKP